MSRYLEDGAPRNDEAGAERVLESGSTGPPPTTTIVQEGFRWRNDDGDEDGATWKAAQDTNTTLAVDGSARLRTIIDTTGEATLTTTLYYRKVASYLSEVLADDPVAVWMLDETSGTTAVDSGPNGLDGTYNSTYTLNATTIFGLPAPDFPADGWVEIPDDDLFSPQVGGSGTISFEALIKFDVLDGTRTIVAKGAGSQYEWQIGTYDTYRMSIYIWHTSGQIDRGGNTNNYVLTTGVDYHVVGTFDQVTSALHLYVNGLEAELSTWTEGGDAANGTAPVTIGRRGDGAWQMDGKVAGVAIYPTVLSPVRVAAHYKVLTSPTWQRVPLEIELAPVTTGYRYYRWTSLIRKDPGAGATQLSEFHMLVGGSRVAATAVTGASTYGYPPINLNDNNTATFWFTQGGDGDPGNNINTVTVPGFFVMDYGAPIVPSGYRWYTAHDATDRDSTGWLLEGSNDSTTWVPLDLQTGYAVTDTRQAIVGPFSLTNFVPPTSFRYLRWISLKRRQWYEGGVQANEFQILIDGVPLPATAVSGPVAAWSDIDNINDNIYGGGNKWEFYEGMNATMTPTIVFDYGTTITPDGYRWFTAGDAAERDTVSWAIEVSDDGSTWKPLDYRVLYPVPTARSTIVGPFPIGAGIPVYVATSSNITAGGEATTALLAAPAGKSTADFSVGRMWDDENGTDTVTIGP